MSVIRLENIKKSYYLGKEELPVLKGVSLSINRGDFAAIVGASGSGKSTLMNIIGLLDHPSEGRYFLNEEWVAQFSSDELAALRNRTIGFIFQSFFLLPRLKAWQNVGLPLTYRGESPEVIYKRSMENLYRMGIGHLSEHRPSELSGGQQQRVAIARALIGHPHVILADEPTGALDSKTTDEVLEILKELNQNEKATVVIITHDMSVAERCQHVIRVQDGLIIDDGK